MAKRELVNKWYVVVSTILPELSFHPRRKLLSRRLLPPVFLLSSTGSQLHLSEEGEGAERDLVGGGSEGHSRRRDHGGRPVSFKGSSCPGWLSPEGLSASFALLCE